MKVILDTNAYSDWVRSQAWAVEVSAARVVLIPSIVLGELREGFFGGFRTTENETLLTKVLSNNTVSIANISDETSHIYARLKNDLRTRGKPIPENDIWIAASCLEHGATLLTRDRHFELLPQVRLARSR